MYVYVCKHMYGDTMTSTIPRSMHGCKGACYLLGVCYSHGNQGQSCYSSVTDCTNCPNYCSDDKTCFESMYMIIYTYMNVFSVRKVVSCIDTIICIVVYIQYIYTLKYMQYTCNFLGTRTKSPFFTLHVYARICSV